MRNDGKIVWVSIKPNNCGSLPQLLWLGLNVLNWNDEGAQVSLQDPSRTVNCRSRAGYATPWMATVRAIWLLSSFHAYLSKKTSPDSGPFGNIDLP